MVVANGDSSSIFGEDDNRGSGARGVFQIKNLWVHDNTISVDTGYTGLWDNKGSGAVWSNNNRFDSNTYTATGTTKPFLWTGNKFYTWEQWQAIGQDVNGTIK